MPGLLVCAKLKRIEEKSWTGAFPLVRGEGASAAVVSCFETGMW
jgi:hypothetical protein